MTDLIGIRSAWKMLGWAALLLLLAATAAQTLSTAAQAGRTGEQTQVSPAAKPAAMARQAAAQGPPTPAPHAEAERRFLAEQASGYLLVRMPSAGQLPEPAPQQ